jgi:predicted nucleic acid-binding protein
MRNVVIDTCVMIAILRESDTGLKCIQKLSEFDSDLNIIISVATKGEIESFSKQNNWGLKKLNNIKSFIDAATVIDIKQTDNQLINNYVQIDG